MAAATVVALPVLASSAAIASSRLPAFSYRILPALAIALPPVHQSIPALLGNIWESVLRAVPKNKVSHSRKRHRQMAGKALPDVNSLCKCPGCGAEKRTHRLCENCHNEMREMWRRDAEVKGKTML